MAKQKRKKRRVKQPVKYGISLLIFSVFILGLYGLFHIGQWTLVKNAPSNSQNKPVVSLGIDVSEWQNDVNYQKVKLEGYSFVIIRSSYGMYAHEDANFHTHIQNASKAGLDVGVYHYSYAMNEYEARQEAEFVISVVGDYDLDLPIFYDIETEYQNELSRKELTNIALTFLTTLEEHGYQGGIYAAQSWFEDRLDMDILSGYPIWIASYSETLNYDGHYDYWQYTDQGEVDGVSGHCDINIAYKK